MANRNEEIEKLGAERFKQAGDAENSNRQRAIEDIRFVDIDEQWDDVTRSDRERNGRPCMVINKCNGVVKQISNDARQNKPRIKVRAEDSKADPQIAELFNGLIRNIENMSDADSAYDTGIDQAIKGGWGYWRVVTEYVDDDVFEQDIRIKRIVNQFSVYLDPAAKEADKSDANWGFITEVLKKTEFDRQYPKEDGTSWSHQGAGEGNTDWFTTDGIRIAEYYYKEPVTKTLWQVSTVGEDGEEELDTIEAGDQEVLEQNGERYFLTEREVETPDTNEVQQEAPGQVQPQVGMEGQEQPLMGGPEMQGMMPQEPVQPQPIQPPPSYTVTKIVKERKVKSHKVMWCKLAGGAVIDGPTEQASKYIPIVACIGDEAWIEGEPVYKSAFFHAKDAQRLYNWARSNAVETLALSPKQPFIGTEAMFEGHESEWDQANHTPKMRLTANFDNGKLPQRQQLTISDTGALQEAMQSADDIKSTTGLFDASLGASGNEKSGVAITARQRESDTSTYHFPDNQARAIRFTGRILVDLIPKIYDTDRVVRLLNEDGKEAWERINIRIADPNQPEGYRVANDISVGRYDVVCDVGPGFMTKRIEANEHMSAILQSVPMAAPVLVPRIAKNGDWPDAEEVGEELQQLFQPQPEQQQVDPAQQEKDQLDIEGKQLVNAQREMDLQQKPQSQQLVDAQRVQNMEQSGAAHDEQVYQIAQQAIADTLKQLGYGG